ncbi:MAG: hypothetical protein LBU20_01375 [Candidatus Nomurabacteria bacterium]|jgi:hypothetical protein|nr:hypothetical protein [Candidatus Nomurabacteria bacterium]
MDSKPKTLAKKAAIYVDIDDDLTTVVGKIRASVADVIALVPPKRIGILQSAVNLKLLARTAAASHKKLIIVTADNALAVLAAGAKIPTAFSLTGEPKLAEIPKLDSKDQIIEGESAPRIIKKNNPDDDVEISAAVKALADDDKIQSDEPNIKKNLKIPNFNDFKKWIIIGAAGLVALIGVIIWLVLSTSATITITAKTSDEKIDQAITIAKDNGATNAAGFKVKAIVLDPVKKLTEIEFTATGKKEVGEKARGQVMITNSENLDPVSISAGTYVFINNSRYTLDAAVTVPKVTGTVSAPIDGEVTASVTAEAMGAEYNTNSGVSATIAGYNAGDAKVASGGITGGSKENITVVQQSDIDKITDKLKSDTENNNMKTDLQGRFDISTRAVPESFEISFGAVTSSPVVGEKADKAKASIEITYSMFGLKNDDVNNLLMAAAVGKLNNSGLGVFDNGYNQVQVLSFQATPTGGTARLVTTAKIGPAIDDEKLKSETAGMKKNEVKQMIEKISGVEKVEVSYFPFWVTKAPEGKITIVKNGF